MNRAFHLTRIEPSETVSSIDGRRTLSGAIFSEPLCFASRRDSTRRQVEPSALEMLRNSSRQVSAEEFMEAFRRDTSNPHVRSDLSRNVEDLLFESGLEVYEKLQVRQLASGFERCLGLLHSRAKAGFPDVMTFFAMYNFIDRPGSDGAPRREVVHAADRDYCLKLLDCIIKIAKTKLLNLSVGDSTAESWLKCARFAVRAKNYFDK